MVKIRGSGANPLSSAKKLLFPDKTKDNEVRQSVPPEFGGPVPVGRDTNIPGVDQPLPDIQTEPQIIRDEETGRKTGLVLPGGKSFLGINEKEVNALATGKQAERGGALAELEKGRQEEEALSQLEQEQAKELSKIDALKSLQDQQDTATRLAQAGLLTTAQALNAISFGIADIQGGTDVRNVEDFGPLKGVFSVIGRASNVEVFGFSIQDLGLGSAASANVKNLQSDSSKIVTESQNILRTALTRSPSRPKSNIYQGIESQRLLEAEVNSRYNNALISLKESPKDISAGLDLYDAMSSDLRVVAENRQMMERFAVTGDPQEIINAMGGFPQA